jgi:[acyl-carrier-protein] S-malonyltransferase
MALAKQKGAKMVKALTVSAPFHSKLMAPAAEKLRVELERIKIEPLAVPVVANVDGEPNRDAARVKELLFQQVTGSVRWEQSLQKLAAMGVDEAFEVGPGNVLAGLVKRTTPTIKMGVLDG